MHVLACCPLKMMISYVEIYVLVTSLTLRIYMVVQGTKIPLVAHYEQNVERKSNSSQTTHPTGRVLWEE